MAALRPGPPRRTITNYGWSTRLEALVQQSESIAAETRNTGTSAAVHVGGHMRMRGSVIAGGSVDQSRKRRITFIGGGLAALLLAGGTTVVIQNSHGSGIGGVRFTLGDSHVASDLGRDPGKNGVRQVAAALKVAEISGDAKAWCRLTDTSELFGTQDECIESLSRTFKKYEKLAHRNGIDQTSLVAVETITDDLQRGAVVDFKISNNPRAKRSTESGQEACNLIYGTTKFGMLYKDGRWIAEPRDSSLGFADVNLHYTFFLGYYCASLLPGDGVS